MLFFRCTECHCVVSKKDIKRGKGCRRCGGGRVSPTGLSFVEKVVEIMRWPGMLLKLSSWKTDTMLPGVGKRK